VRSVSSRLISLAAVAFVVSFAVTWLDLPDKLVGVGQASGAFANPGPDGPRYEPAYAHKSGEELSLVFIGKLGCSWSNHESLPRLIGDAKLQLAERALADGRTFRTTGVALDWEVASGLDFLAKFGTFDEVAAGNNWANAMAMTYLWGELGGRPATPQIVVVRRNWTVPETDDSAARFTIRDEEVLARFVGLYEIRSWAEDGYPLRDAVPFVVEGS